MRIFSYPVTPFSSIPLIEPVLETLVSPSIAPALAILAMGAAAQSDILDTSYLTDTILAPLISREAFYPNLAVTAII